MKLRSVLKAAATLTVSVLITREYLAVIWIKPPDPTGIAAPIALPPKISNFVVPIQIDLSQVAGVVNQYAPSSISGTHHIRARVKPVVKFHGFRTHIEFEEEEVAHVDYQVNRSTILLGASEGRVSVQVPLNAHVKAIPGGSQGSISGIVRGSSTVTVGSDFNLKPDVNVDVALDHAVIDLATIRVLNHDVGISIPIKDLAQQKINEAVNGVKGRIGEEISKAVDLRSIAERAWANIPGSVRVPGVDNVWLTIDPKAVMIDGPYANNGTLTATLAMQAEVATYFQPTQPAFPARSPLPDLTKATADKDFHIALPVLLDLGELNHALLSAVKRQGTIKLGKDQEIVVQNASVFGAGNRLYVKVSVEGKRGFWMKKVKGTIVCGAVPNLDCAKQILTFDQVEFTTETRNALAASAEWLLEPIIVHELQRRMAVDLSTTLRKASEHATQMADRFQLPPPLELDLKVKNISAESIRVFGNKVCVEFDSSGTCKLSNGAKVTTVAGISRGKMRS